MEQFFQQHRNFTLSLLWLLFGIMLAGYSLLYRPLQLSMKALTPLTSQLDEQNKSLQSKIDAQQNMDKAKAVGISSLPAFLARINELSSTHKVVINKLTPEGEGRLRINLEINADFYTFLRFVAHLETLDVVLDNVEIHPFTYDPKNSDLPIHFISFAITPQNNAEPLKSGATQELMRKVKEAIEVHNLRNPFQRYAKDHRKDPEQLVDLTWVYKLGGFGVGNDGVTYAIIDNLEYRKGATMDGRDITEIDKGAGRVMMEKRTEQGTKMKYVLKFRKKGSSGEAGK
ncbi:MAG: hypothetical protein G8345_11635 [Magnetococcales bacterium]|nr:hypothetical protein [Magnetococcales bacterium]NGZ27526.1 hypothetical protein [Magnetococcales bacterium]